MRKSPGRWLKTLFGKKSSRSSSTKSKNSSEKGLSQGYEAPLGDNSPIISEPVLVSTYSNTNLPIVEETHFSDMHGCETTLPVVSQSALDQVPIQNQSRGCNKLCEEKAATKAQAAIRGFLARREFRALKGVVRLQALVRGHLVRRQAIATLYAMYAIVRLQVIVRGRIARHSNISLPVNYAKSQHDVLMSCTSGDAWKKNFQDNSLGHQLLYSRVVFKPLLVQFKKEDPNSVSSWLERWHLTHFWKPVVKADHSKPQQRKSKKVSANQTLKTNPKLTKHQASKSEPEKRKDNLHRQTTQVPKTEIEKPKQVLKKVANSRSDAETGKLSSGSKKSHSKAVREISKDSETTSETVNANSSEVRLSLSGDEESKKVIHKRSSLSTPVEVAEKESNVEATTSEGKSLSDNREAGSRSNSRRSSLSTTRPEIPEKELHSTLSSSAAKTLLDRNASEEKSLSSTKDSGTKLNNKRRSSLSDASKTMPDGKLSEEKPLSSSGNSVNKLNSRRRSSLSAAASKTIPDAKPSEEKPLSSSGDSSDNSGNKLNSRRRSSISDVSKTMPDGKPSEGKPLSSSGDSADKSNNRRRSSLSTTRLEISENELNVSVNKSASKILTDVNSSEEKSLSSNGEPTNRSNNRRRSSFSAGVEIPETELHSSTLKSVPSYMATTESAKARLRGQSSPRVVTTPDTADKNGPVRRHSLPSGSANGKLKSISPRTQKPLNSGGSKGLIKGDRSLNLSRDGSEKSVHTEWRRW